MVDYFRILYGHLAFGESEADFFRREEFLLKSLDNVIEDSNAHRLHWRRVRANGFEKYKANVSLHNGDNLPIMLPVILQTLLSLKPKKEDYFLQELAI